jgi:DDE superfamily endonuclease
MDFLVNEPADLVKEYFSGFDNLWSRKEQREYFEKSVMGFLSDTHRKNIERISEKIIAQDYQNLHHFMTTSPWSREQMNEQRISFIKKSNAFPNKNACLIFDDSGVMKRGHATENVAPQYIGQVGKVANGNVFVTSHLANSKRHVPLDIEMFKPRDKDEPEDEKLHRRKIDIALDLVDKAIDRGIEFKYVIADAWYGSSPDFIDYLEKKGLTYIVSIKSNRKIFYKFPNEQRSLEYKLSEILPLIKQEQFRPIEIPLSDGTILKKYFVRMDLKVKGLVGKRRIIIESDRTTNLENADIQYYLSNAVMLRDANIVRQYHLRNWIEVFYREVKDFIGADDYQVRSMERVMRHWALCFVAYSLIQWLQHGKLLKKLVKKN